MNICMIFVLYNLQKLSSWIIYKVHVHVHILPNQDWLVPEFSTFSTLILICYYWSPDIGINKKDCSAKRNDLYENFEKRGEEETKSMPHAPVH
jgi:hypothetical protein